MLRSLVIAAGLLLLVAPALAQQQDTVESLRHAMTIQNSYLLHCVPAAGRLQVAHDKLQAENVRLRAELEKLKPEKSEPEM